MSFRIENEFDYRYLRPDDAETERASENDRERQDSTVRRRYSAPGEDNRRNRK